PPDGAERPDGDALRRRRQHRGARSVPIPRLHGPPDGSRLHRRHPRMTARSRYDLDRAELGEVLAGEPRYRADQVWQGLYEQLTEPGQMTTLPRTLRERLDDVLPAALTAVTEQTSASGDTVKLLWRLHDGV